MLEGLDSPWDIEAHGGIFYITEKAGTLDLFDGTSFARLPIITSAPILDDRGGGLMGLALRPDFEEAGRAFLYHHTGTPEARSNRVIEVVRDGVSWRETRVLLDDIPGHPLYNGGRVAFGPDGILYVTTGWTENRQRPQDMDSLADNSFPGSPVYSLGHRNPQGLAWGADGQLYAAEHGQSCHDEVNRIDAGQNYGWPVIQGDEGREGMQGPLVHSGHNTWAPSGLTWDGERLLLAGLRAGGIVANTPEEGTARAYPVDWRLRDVVVVGDQVFAITSNRSPRRDGASDDRMIRLSK
ncbi:PQQ-dependent sugar dehydrogenase [Mameliella alba]|uniref:PQQ-dependent sugar dehydrogenase n=1 Tax=Mameliella alba TaxID=561184 RepID=UPI0031587205